MIGRTDFGHDQDAAIVAKLLARAEDAYRTAKAASDAASATTRHAQQLVRDLQRRLFHVEHHP